MVLFVQRNASPLNLLLSLSTTMILYAPLSLLSRAQHKLTLLIQQQDVYEVERVIAKRVGKYKATEYFIKWIVSMVAFSARVAPHSQIHREQ